jgi:pimeloyl-ACP methyl ester carboxylesterase
MSPPNPLRGLASDSAYVASYLKSIQGPIVLVGHSYGGAVITDAATGNANVKALVYVDAYIPDTGDTVLGESIKAFSETDFTEDLKKIDVPTLVLHGEDDQIVPVKDSAHKSAKLIANATEIYYPGAPHGLTDTHANQFDADLLAFLQSTDTTEDQGGV